jgi:predicted aspartyl protease
MHFIRTVSLLLATQIAAAVGNAAAQQQAPEFAPQFESTEPLLAAPTTLDSIGRIVVPVMLNGVGPFKFVLDTGANRSVLSAATAQKLSLEPSLEHAIEVNGVTGIHYLPTVAVDRLDAGALAMQALRLPVAQSVMGGAEGILGVEGFDNMLLSVDFRANKIEITRSLRARANTGFLVVPLRFRHGRLLTVDVMVGNTKAKAVIDTGAERTLGNERLRTALARKSKRTASRDTEVEGISATKQPGKAVMTPTIRMAGTDISDVEVVFGDFFVFKLWELDAEPALLIGMDVMGVLDKVNVDYRRKELHLRPRSRVP